MNIGVVDQNPEIQSLYKSYLSRQLGATVCEVTLLTHLVVGEGKVTDLDVVIAEPSPIKCTATWVDGFRSRYPAVPLIIASQNEDIVKATRNRNGVAALTKPFHMEELAELIEVILDPAEISVDRCFH
jgi:DNA-binding response OmpR family regulator